MKKSPSNKWTTNLTEKEDKQEFCKKLLEQTHILERLYDIVEAYDVANKTTKLKKENYDSPSWAMYQADSIGYSRAMSEIKFLLKFTKENEDV